MTREDIKLLDKDSALELPWRDLEWGRKYDYSGVYAIKDLSDLFHHFLYIGSSRNLAKRLLYHPKYIPNLHRIYTLRHDSISTLEMLEVKLINIFNPPLNKIKVEVGIHIIDRSRSPTGELPANFFIAVAPPRR
jgi:hypothetical protein